MTGFSLLLLLLLTDAPRLALAESRKIRVKTDSRWFDISINEAGWWMSMARQNERPGQQFGEGDGSGKW